MTRLAARLATRPVVAEIVLVVAAYLLTAGALGVYFATVRDRVVHEQIARAAPDSGNRLLARGAFTSAGHETSGVARAVRLRLGGRALTLDLRTSAGPDLRVYLAQGDGADFGEHIDLGGLQGNIGTKQYAIPAGTDLDRYTAVVIYSRAVSAPFGSAILRPTT